MLWVHPDIIDVFYRNEWKRNLQKSSKIGILGLKESMWDETKKTQSNNNFNSNVIFNMR
jgi:hypothetical protein